MKDLLKSMKWMGGQARPCILSFSLIIIIAAVLSLCSVSIAIVSKGLVDAAVAREGHQAAWAAISFAGLILLQVGLKAVASILSVRTLEGISNKIRKRLFTHLLKAEWASSSKYHSDDILTRLTSDIGTVANGIANVLPAIIALVVQLAAAFVTLLFLDPILAALAFVLGPVSVLLTRVLGHKLKQMHLKIQEAEVTYRAFLHESIQNVLIVKAFCIEENNTARFDNLQSERMDLVLKRNRMNVTTSSILSLGYWLGYFLAFGWGALHLSRGTVSFGTLTAFLQLVGQIQAPFSGLAQTLPQVISTVASAERLMELERMQHEQNNGMVPCWTNAGIILDNVHFAYGNDTPVLKNATFEVYPGETVAITGMSGEGKTTLLRLLLSLVEPGVGHIYFTGGQDEKFEACASSRRLISYVPQGNTLFSGTIEENLRIGCSDVTNMEMEAAVRSACAWEFIKKMPKGLKTVIGERGHGISEGQAQRLAIARALLHKAPILVLDEATSALDSYTEKCVLQAIRSLSPARTCIIITHRSTALGICNRVLKLENGYLVEHHGLFTAGQANEAV